MSSTKLVILGITGSIGTQTVALAKKLGYRIVGCSYHTNHESAKKIIKANKIKHVYCSSSKKGSFDQLIKQAKPDLVVNAIIGFAGLEATIAAIKNKVNIALANKESLVAAGKLVMDLAKAKKVRVLPIDSEHSNLYRQLLTCDTKDVNQIYITGSGGKYLNQPKSIMSKVTYEQATSHKNWVMGPKITIDSNTLMNKCFEVIEAYWYFKTKRINVLLDKTSLIHSAILMNDGSFSFSESLPLMTTPIAWALTNFNCPTSIENAVAKTHTTEVMPLMNDIVPIKWAYEVINDKTNSLGIILNAADEVAIKLFKNKKLRFDQIVDFIAKAKKNIKPKTIKTYAQVKAFDKYVREQLTK